MTAYPALPEASGLSRALLPKLGSPIPADRMSRRLLPGFLIVLVRHDMILAHTRCRRAKNPELCVYDVPPTSTPGHRTRGPSGRLG
jgi:hypothetical protein